MTFQEAAHKILMEKGHPLDPKKIADIAFQKGMVKSKANDPTRSFVETIKKNIRGNKYNVPELAIIKAPNGKLIGLPYDNLPQPVISLGFPLHPPLFSGRKLMHFVFSSIEL